MELELATAGFTSAIKLSQLMKTAALLAESQALAIGYKTGHVAVMGAYSIPLKISLLVN